MNFGAFKTAAQNALKAQFSPQKGPWSLAEFTDALDSAHYNLFALIAALYEGFCSSSATLNETAGTAQISLPTTLYKLTRLERVKGGSTTLATPVPIDVIDRDPDSIYQARLTAVAGVTEFYFQQGQKLIELLPTPTANATASLKVTYTFRPARMGAADTDVPFQETAGTGGAGADDLREWHDIMLFDALEQLLAKNHEDDKLQYYQGRRREREQKLGTFLKSVNSQANRSVRYVPTLHDEMWW